MIRFLVSVLLVGLALLAIALRRTYAIVPPKELKRQAQQGDELARVLYKAVGYGASLQVLLWAIIVLATAASFVLLSSSTPNWLAFIIEIGVLAYAFAWMPTSDVTTMGVRIVVFSTPVITWLLAHLQPVLGRIAAFIRRHHPISMHTGLYEREDVVALLERQRKQEDSRLTPAEIDLVIHALTYSQKQVVDILIPKRAIRTVSAEETVGPILMDELHESGHSRFPVFENNGDNIVGTLYLRDLVNAKKSGAIRKIMEPAVYYVHEQYTLDQVLDAFLKTKHHMFVVVNNFEEYVGIITIEDILEQVIGRQIVDEFDNYDDMRAVAAHQADKERRKRKKVPETVTEVVK